MRVFCILLVAVVVATSCGSAAPTPAVDPTPTPEPTATSAVLDETTGPGVGDYNFDRSDPESGIADIMAAFATDEATATCIYEQWGDVANVPPAELTPELMTAEVCGTSIFQLMTGDPRFTGQD